MRPRRQLGTRWSLWGYLATFRLRYGWEEERAMIHGGRAEAPT